MLLSGGSGLLRLVWLASAGMAKGLVGWAGAWLGLTVGGRLRRGLGAALFIKLSPLYAVRGWLGMAVLGALGCRRVLSGYSDLSGGGDRGGVAACWGAGVADAVPRCVRDVAVCG